MMLSRPKEGHPMTVFKTLDIRGLSFFNAFTLTNEAVNDVNSDGILELILDKKKNFTEAFKEWAQKKGYRISDVDEEDGLIRLFIKKVGRIKSRGK
jgi:TusA-related sulfurtransferase